MKNLILLFRVFVLLFICVIPIAAQDGSLLAFPGAEGFGRFAQGGRYGQVYHVTNLNDSGEGSLRDAVSQPNRIVVFDVSGMIRLKSVLVFSSNLTIAAHTAPGEGILLYGDRVSFSGASNVICRYLRVRMGTYGPDGKDAAGIASGSNMIFDHMSVTWGRDENFSINSTDAKDITIQNSIIGQGLQNHSCGGLIQTSIDNGVSLFRNLYIDNKTRNPKVKGLNQFVNNVVYNWGSGAAYNMSGDSEGESLTIIEDNYFITGPVENWQNVRQEDGSIKVEKVPMSPTKPFIGANAKFSTFCRQNWYDFDKNGKLDGVEIIPGTNWEEHCSDMPTFLEERPSQFPAIGQQSTAEEAYHWIVKNVGASLPVRDQVDGFLIGELSSLGGLGTIIQNEQDLQQFPLGGPGEILRGRKLLDTDNDGMPDVWEDAQGLNKEDASDAMIIAANGYANIENYINSIDAPIPFLACATFMKGKAVQDNIELSWYDYSEGEDGYVLEQRNTDGQFVEIAKLPANAVSYTATNLAPGTLYAFRLKSFNSTEESLYSDVLEVTTKRVPVVPELCVDPVPAHQAVLKQAASREITLSWKNNSHPDSGTTTYKVFVGDDADNLVCVSGIDAIEETMYSFYCETDKTYYWRVDAFNGQGNTTGTVWQFVTEKLDVKDPVVHLKVDGNLKNSARTGFALDALATSLDPTYVDGKKGQAIILENVQANSCITVPYYEGLKFEGGSGTKDPNASFTVSMWVKSDGECALNGKAYLFHKGTFKDSKGKARWCGAEIRNGELYFAVSQNGTKHEVKLASGNAFKAIFNNEWHHLVFVRSHEDQALIAYCDGKLLGRRSSDRAYMSSEVGIMFGNVMENCNEPFTGMLDEMMLFRGTLSAEEVANLYATGNTAGLLTGLSQLEGVGRDLIVYPSPFFNHFYVKVSSDKTSVMVKMHDASGRLVLVRQEVAANGLVFVDGLNRLPAGTYIVSVDSGSSVQSQVVLKK